MFVYQPIMTFIIFCQSKCYFFQGWQLFWVNLSDFEYWKYVWISIFLLQTLITINKISNPDHSSPSKKGGRLLGRGLPFGRIRYHPLAPMDQDWPVYGPESQHFHCFSGQSFRKISWCLWIIMSNSVTERDSLLSLCMWMIVSSDLIRIRILCMSLSYCVFEVWILWIVVK